MRALVSQRCGPPDTLVLADLPDPKAGPRQICVGVEACGINYPDVLMIEDRYQTIIERPFAPGIEICGRIESLGSDVHDLAPGMRVVAQITSGGLAEKAIVDVDRLIPVPDGVSAEQAASLLLTYGTSYHALRDRAGLRPGETLLVLGAGGGVGLAAVELGKLMGARVIAAASSRAKAEKARAAGADDVVVYGTEVEQRALAAQFKAACPHGADVIYDPVGGDYAEPAFRAINWQGRYLVVGFPAGIPRLALNLVLLKGAQIIGVFWGAAIERDPAAMRASVTEVFAWVRDGALSPLPPTLYPLNEAGKAIASLGERQAIGKLVVSIQDAASSR